MRSVALVLGALPPFEGPWVPISEGVVWDLVVKTQTIGLDVNGQVEVEVDGWYRSTIQLPSGLWLMGQRARAVIGKEFEEGLESISVFLEEAE